MWLGCGRSTGPALPWTWHPSSATFKVRRSSFREFAQPFETVFRIGGRFVVAGLDLETVVEGETQSFIDGVLGSGHGERTVGGDRRCDLQADFPQQALRCNSIDQADRQGLDRLHLAPGEDDVLGAARTDQPGQPLCASCAWNDPQLDLGQAELRTGKRNAEVAGKRDLGSPAKRDPIDTGDEDNVTLFHPAQHSLDLLQEEPNLGFTHPAPLFEIGAGTESLRSGASKDDHPGSAIVRNALEELFQLDHHRPADRIAAGLPKDRPDLRRARLFDLEFRHRYLRASKLDRHTTHRHPRASAGARRWASAA